MQVEISCASAIMQTVKKYIPKSVIKRLVLANPTWRDLYARLIQMPLLKRGHFAADVPDPDNVDAFIRYAQLHKYVLCYGYRVRQDGTKDYIDTVLMALDKKDRLVENEKTRLNNTSFYVGIRIPEEDIKSRRYAMKFEQMNYVLKNMER